MTPLLDSRLEAVRRQYETGSFALAEAALRRLPADLQESRDARLLLGASLARLRRSAEAVETFTRLLEIDPDCHEALTWMAALTRDPRDMGRSLDFARRAVELRPEDPSGYGVLGSGYLTARLPDLAIESFLRAIALAPNVAEYRHNLALAYLMQDRHGDAIAQLKAAIELAPADPQNYLVLASTYSLFAKAGEAIECLYRGLQHQPASAPLHTAIAGAYASIRNDEAAEAHHRRAMRLSPEGKGGFAAWLLNQGHFIEAAETFQSMVAEGSDPAYGFYGLVQAQKDVDPRLVQEMHALLESGRLRPRQEMYLRYALGRAEEGERRYESAMGHFDAANRLAQSIYHHGRAADPARFASEHRQIHELYKGMRRDGVSGDPAPSPIFIVGMIRSGTTLLDQIVSSHPDVASGGELRFWIEETHRLVAKGQPVTSEDLRELASSYMDYGRLLSGGEGHITDKMPLNFAVMGPIHAAMPSARFLHIRRNPVDTCLSIWTTFFGQGPVFAYDKRSIVAYYRQYLVAMDFWRQALPTDRLLEIDYESLISAPEATIRQIVEFLGLPWNDACLNHERNESAINTPSRWQARQPIYRTSLERWRRYEPWLGEFAELLNANGSA